MRPADLLLRVVSDPPEPGQRVPPAGGGAGPAGNARFTALTGTMLLLPLAVVLASGVFFGDARTVHFFAGFVVIPPVGLKLATTGWHAARYYIRDRRDHGYRALGPPGWTSRALGPVLVAAAILVLGSGVALWVQRTEHGPWSTVHTDSAVVLALALGGHLLLRAWRTAWHTAADLGMVAAPPLPGRTWRRAMVTASLACGVVIAAAAVLPTTWPPQVPRHHDAVQLSP
jgi:hypothetical protein